MGAHYPLSTTTLLCLPDFSIAGVAQGGRCWQFATSFCSGAFLSLANAAVKSMLRDKISLEPSAILRRVAGKLIETFFECLFDDSFSDEFAV